MPGEKSIDSHGIIGLIPLRENAEKGKRENGTTA
jgi:hypothetical protein